MTVEKPAAVASVALLNPALAQDEGNCNGFANAGKENRDDRRLIAIVSLES